MAHEKDNPADPVTECPHGLACPRARPEADRRDDPRRGRRRPRPRLEPRRPARPRPRRRGAPARVLPRGRAGDRPPPRRDPEPARGRDREELQHRRPGLPRLHSRGRRLRLGPRRLHRHRHEPLRGRERRRARPGPDRGDGGLLAVHADGPARGIARHPHLRRLPLELQRPRHRAERLGEDFRTSALLLRPDPLLRHETARRRLPPRASRSADGRASG
jgi:hypothetical protein